MFPRIGATAAADFAMPEPSENPAFRSAASSAANDADARYRALVELLPEAVWVTQHDRIVFINRAGCQLLGEPDASRVLGRAPAEFMPRGFRAVVREQLREVLEAGRTVRFLPAALQPAGGREVPVEIAAAPFVFAGARAVLVLVRDLTGRREAEAEIIRSREELRTLAVRLQETSEEQAQRLAREVHDKLGQALTALSLDAGWLAARSAAIGDPAQRAAYEQRVARMRSLLEETVRTVQRIATELRPGAIEDFGLIGALEDYAATLAERSGLRCHWEEKPARLDLPLARATAVFRIFQEAATNIVRHAAATQMQWAVRVAPDGIVFELRDDGRGFDLGSATPASTLGMLGMRERALAIDGRLEISRAPGGGTLVRLTLAA